MYPNLPTQLVNLPLKSRRLLLLMIKTATKAPLAVSLISLNNEMLRNSKKNLRMTHPVNILIAYYLEDN